MIIDDWLPCGYATLLAGHGGHGKSSIALYLAVCIATGRPFFGLPTEQRRVLYLSCEDRQDVLHWRLARICRHLDVDMAELATHKTNDSSDAGFSGNDRTVVSSSKMNQHGDSFALGHLDIIDLVGENATLWERTSNGGGTTGPFNLLTGTLSDAEVLIVDGVADTFAGNENDRGDAKRFVNALVGLIPPDRGAVILIHHVNKPAAGTSTSEGYSGSTGWHNAVRARWYLYPEIEQSDEGTDRTGRQILELQKSNLGKADQRMVFEWDDHAHLFLGQLAAGTSAVERNMRDEKELDGIVAAIREVESRGDYVPAAMQGPRTAHHVLMATESLPETLKSKAATKRFRRHIEELRRIRRIEESSIRLKNRTYLATLTLKATEDVACTNAQHSISEAHTNSGAVEECTNAQHSLGGYRGVVHSHCPRCDDEGDCPWCGR